VYVSIGQKKSSVLEVIDALEEHGAMEHTIVVVADPDDPPALGYLAPYSGCTMAEEFVYRGGDALIVYDDLSKHAQTYRELSLLLRRPPGREAYPGDIFYLHSRLMERAGQFGEELGGGSLTTLAIGETRMGNIAAYIPTNLISMTDGQIYLDPELFNRGFKPAINVGLSVSRVGGQAQTEAMRRVSKKLRLELAQYHEVESFARFGTEVDEATRKQIVRGERLREVLKQGQYAPMPLERQIAILYAVGEGYLDDLPLEKVADFEASFLRFIEEEHPSIYRRLRERWELDGELERDLRGAIEAFKFKIWKISRG
jgi:F-type H+-transporting ATPase subunit alpha